MADNTGVDVCDKTGSAAAVASIATRSAGELGRSAAQKVHDVAVADGPASYSPSPLVRRSFASAMRVRSDPRAARLAASWPGRSER